MNCDKKDLLLYAVTDRAWLNGETLCSQVEKAIKGGATFIQLREKNLDQKHFLEEALEIQKLCKKYNVPFVINDNVEIAKEIDADGVHVGQSDMEAGNVRKILGDDKSSVFRLRLLNRLFLLRSTEQIISESEQFSKQAQRTMQTMFHTMNFRKFVRLLTFL